MAAETEHENADFKLKSYWNERFTKESSYEWLVKFEDVQELLKPWLGPVESRILIVGCGNSSFSSDLYDAGYENIVNIDFSDVCIENMKKRNEVSRPNMKWLCKDMTELDEFATDSFDVIVDKASMDALHVDEGDVWDPNEDCVQITDKMCLGLSRVLQGKGTFIQITFAQPHFRTKYLMAKHVLKFDSSPFEPLKGFCPHYQWDLSYISVDQRVGCINYFIYFMKLNKA